MRGGLTEARLLGINGQGSFRCGFHSLVGGLIMMLRQFFIAATLFVPMFVFGQVPFPQMPQPVATFSYEDKDWGVEAANTPRQGSPHAYTPTAIPGARVIKTLELKALLEANKNVLVIDVLDSKSRKTIPGAYWMPGAGDGRFYRAEKSRFAAALDKLSGGDKSRPIVFLCVSSECWLSYNASLHALEAGYTDVIWYRGGTNAWKAANLDLAEPARINW